MKAFATLEAFLGAILNPILNTTQAVLSSLFDGSAVSTYGLQQIISNGSILSQQNPSVPDSVTTMRQIMFGYMTPVAWATSNQYLCPFVLDYGQDYGPGCHQVTYFDNWSSSAKTCYNNRTYFLLNVNGVSIDDSCTLAPLPGNKDLVNGTYGITLDNLVYG